MLQRLAEAAGDMGDPPGLQPASTRCAGDGRSKRRFMSGSSARSLTVSACVTASPRADALAPAALEAGTLVRLLAAADASSESSAKTGIAAGGHQRPAAA